MKLKMLPIAALAAALASGAFAQTDPVEATKTDPGAADKQNSQVDPTVTSSLEDTNLMKPFFTDETMTTIRPVEEIRTAWAAMAEENRMKVQKDCETSNSIKFKEFCGAIEGM